MSRELVVLSHLRWVFVWQRPQHLISRVSSEYDRTWFVEEPFAVEGISEPILRVEEHEHVVRVWLEVPPEFKPAGYDARACEIYSRELVELLGERKSGRTVWLYTPMALDISHALTPEFVVYDVMDDLAAFKFAPEGLLLRQRRLLRDADVVFTGGRSLNRGVVDHRADARCFPSGVEPEHYAPAIAMRSQRIASERADRRPVAGYVGVIDERLDLDLVYKLASELHDWEIRMVGPVVKIDEDDLPQAENITYPGPKQYAELPAVMSEFDVALMPFAMNEATKSISPTKTLEYLAAGLPVVSTRVPDVVSDYAGVVDLRDEAGGFAEACREALAESPVERAERCRPVLAKQHWDNIAAQMSSIIEEARREAAVAVETA